MKMLQVKRYIGNPILVPDKKSHWESYATFNGNVIKEKETFHMFYRAMSDEQNYQGQANFRLSTIGHAQSRDGVHFEKRTQFIKPRYEWERFGCEDPRATKFEGRYYIFYTALSCWPPEARGIKVAVALSDDLKNIREQHLVTPFNAKAMALFPERINGKITVIVTVNTDIPPTHIAIAQFDHIEELWSQDYWRKWWMRIEDHRMHLKRMLADQIEVGAPPIKTEKGWLFTYSYISAYLTGHPTFQVEMAMLDLKDPQRVISRIKEPIMEPQEPYEFDGIVRNIVFPSGVVKEKTNLYIYYGAADTTCAQASAPYKNIISHFEKTSEKTKFL